MIFRNRLKKLNFDKTFEDVIESELDFHGYDTAKIKIQQQPDDINPFMYGLLHLTLSDVLNFNPALKVINITLVYKNDENNIELKDRSKLLMTSVCKLSPPTEKVITGKHPN